tara:strand:+ start:4159 stop:4719 length:561 start_codon:yes stop_codon:yes gene_type:complete
MFNKPILQNIIMLTIEEFNSLGYDKIQTWSVKMVVYEGLGVWFFGLAGSGKTYASNTIAKTKKKPFIVDGDNVRSKISIDLEYTLNDRLVQINRLYGIGILAIENDCFPIISSVYMTDNVQKLCKNSKIKVIRIDREQTQLNKYRAIYENEINVVGKDIAQPDLDTVTILNDGSGNFLKLVKRHAE